MQITERLHFFCELYTGCVNAYTKSVFKPSSSVIVMSLSRKRIRAVLFDLDGTLLDTEALSDKAVIHALGDALPTSIYQELMHTDFRLPWELKKQILGLRANDWVPIVLQYAQEYWGVPMTPNTNYM